MWEKLFIYEKKPEPDTVPALKLLNFPFSEGSWRPFCQLTVFAVKNDGIYFRFKPFEAEPKKATDGIFSGSALTVSLTFPEKSDVLYITADGYGNLEYNTLEGKEFCEKPSVISTNRGGDQQGDYFSVLIKIPFSLTNELFGVNALNEGNKILANAFYSILENQNKYPTHFAALFDKTPDKTPKEKIYNRENNSVITAVEFY